MGICGEHGGDPASIEFCEKLGSVVEGLGIKVWGLGSGFSNWVWSRFRVGAWRTRAFCTSLQTRGNGCGW